MAFYQEYQWISDDYSDIVSQLKMLEESNALGDSGDVAAEYLKNISASMNGINYIMYYDKPVPKGIIYLKNIANNITGLAFCFYAIRYVFENKTDLNYMYIPISVGIIFGILGGYWESKLVDYGRLKPHFERISENIEHTRASSGNLVSSLKSMESGIQEKGENTLKAYRKIVRDAPYLISEIEKFYKMLLREGWVEKVKNT